MDYGPARPLLSFPVSGTWSKSYVGLLCATPETAKLHHSSSLQILLKHLLIAKTMIDATKAEEIRNQIPMLTATTMVTPKSNPGRKDLRITQRIQNSYLLLEMRNPFVM